MLEPVARSAGGRIVAWTRKEVTVHTPLVLASARVASTGHGSGVVIGAGAPVPAGDTRPIVRSHGGFHVTADDLTADEDSPIWSHVAVSRPRRMTGQLSLRRPVANVFATDNEDPDGTPPSGTPPSGTPPSAMPPASGHAPVATNGSASPVASSGSISLPVGPAPDVEGTIHVCAEAASAATDPARLAPRLIEARNRAGPGRLLYAPGVGLVHHLALLVHAGIDIVDTLAVERATLQRQYLSAEGSFDADRLTAGLDDHGTGAPRDWDHETLLAHNLAALDSERRLVSGHIQNGTLRELVEQRARGHPAAAAFLRHLDATRNTDTESLDWPLIVRAETRIHATTQESLQRPDVVRYRDRLRNHYTPPANAPVLLLLPCSAIKPYKRSKSHGVFRRILTDLHQAALVHEVMVTSPLGVVPRELEHTYPAAHYDVPVTGHWDLQEREMIRDQVRALLAIGNYETVVSHLGTHTHALIADLLPDDAVHTGLPHPTDFAARDALRATLRRATAGHRGVLWPHRRLADARSVAYFQFGKAGGDALLDASNDTSGRPPALRLYAQRGKQGNLATFVPDRGVFSLTLPGMKHIFEAGAAKCVEIDDFVPRGTVFAVGVKGADPTIVPGDEVALVHDGTLRGVGVAVASGAEMAAFTRGPCVEVRHHA